MTRGGRAVEADGPGRHLDLAGRRVVDRLHDAALGERGVGHQLDRVEDRAGRDAGRADDLHRLFLGVLAGPGGDDLVDLGGMLAARVLGVVARVALEVLAADGLEQALPMLGVAAAAEDVDVIVRARPACTGRAPRARARQARPGAAAARRGLARKLGARERHAHVVDHRVLHRDLEPAALAGLGRACRAPRGG